MHKGYWQHSTPWTVRIMFLKNKISQINTEQHVPAYSLVSHRDDLLCASRQKNHSFKTMLQVHHHLEAMCNTIFFCWASEFFVTEERFIVGIVQFPIFSWVAFFFALVSFNVCLILHTYKCLSLGLKVAGGVKFEKFLLICCMY